MTRKSQPLLNNPSAITKMNPDWYLLMQCGRNVSSSINLLHLCHKIFRARTIRKEAYMHLYTFTYVYAYSSFHNITLTLCHIQLAQPNPTNLTSATHAARHSLRANITPPKIKNNVYASVVSYLIKAVCMKYRIQSRSCPSTAIVFHSKLSFMYSNEYST